MSNFYYLGSSGPDTNLQLHALRHARVLWRSLEEDYQTSGEATPYLKERCVLVLSTLGLSISQLLGQNAPDVSDTVGYPIDIFTTFAKKHSLDAHWKQQFQRFNYFYNGCRHFGKTVNGGGYRRVEELTFNVTKECFQFGLMLWDEVVRRSSEFPFDAEEFRASELAELKK